MSALPRRLVVEFRPDGVETRVLYRTRTAPPPGTKARKGEVQDLVRAGLTEALRALDAGDVEMIGTAGFETREDTLTAEAYPFLSTPSNNNQATGGG